eukprot:5553452-Amphidinium_carterae.2
MKLDDGSRSENRSALLGAYSRQGYGVSRHSTQCRYLAAQAACHRIASLRSRSALPYTSISVNEGAFPRHTDQNLGPGVVFACGSYTGGALHLHDGEKWHMLDGHDRFILFDGSCEHEVCKYKGFRRSITFFFTRLPDRLLDSHWCALEKLGYPVDACRRLLSSGLLSSWPNCGDKCSVRLGVTSVDHTSGAEEAK